ncbi:MAG: retention module-containing protein, partial [Acidovorax sp.]|nr:retention module-containing protein [Acidovorax sp.]
MAIATALVTKVTGTAWVRDINGNLTPLQEGMRIPVDAEVVTASGSTVQLQADGQPPLTLGENQEVALNADLFEDVPAADAAVAAAVPPELENLIARLDAGQDPLEELDPTAATMQGGGGGGSTFVRLNAVLEATLPLALAYPRPGAEVDEDRRGGEAGTSLPPLYEGTLTLSSQPQVIEGGKIIVTATVDRAPRGSDLVITLKTGETIIIKVGQTSGSVEIGTRTDDAYLQGTDHHVFEVGSTTGGGYDRLDTTSTTSTDVVDDQDATEIVLTSDAQVVEGGKITVTATVDKAPQGSDLVITLKTGEVITIKVGQTTGSVDVPTRTDDGFLQGTDAKIFAIDKASGGNYEALDTSSTTHTDVVDDEDATKIELSSDKSVTEGDKITVTATVDKAPQKSDLVITLKTGEVIVIKKGQLTGSVETSSRVDDGYLQGTETKTFEIDKASGGNYEALDKSSTSSTNVVDDADVVTVKLKATEFTSEDDGSIVYTAILVDSKGNAVTTHNAITVTLKNGEVITIAAGTSAGDSKPVPVDRDDVYVEKDSISNQIKTISEANEGQAGAFENLVADKTPVTTEILDDSDPVFAQIHVDKSAVFEGGALVYTVSLVDANGNPVKVADGKSVTISLNWSGDAANSADVGKLPKTVTIGAGKTSADFKVTTIADKVDEYRETLTVTISGVKDNDGVAKGFEDLQISKTDASTGSTVVDKPSISGQIKVYEKGLTSTADTSETASSVLKVSAGSGLDHI